MWEERAKSNKATGPAPVGEKGENERLAVVKSDSMAVTVASKSLKVVGATEASTENAVAVARHQFEQPRNPVVKTVAKVFKSIRRDKRRKRGFVSEHSE